MDLIRLQLFGLLLCAVLVYAGAVYGVACELLPTPADTILKVLAPPAVVVGLHVLAWRLYRQEQQAGGRRG